MWRRGQLFEGLCGERSWQAGEELFFALGAFGCGLGELVAVELLVNADGVADEDAGDGHRGGEVFVVAEKGGAQFAGVVAAEGCQDHCDAEGDEAQAADAGYDVVAKEAVELGLQVGVVVVEGVLLVQGELKFHFGHSFKVLVDVGEGPADVVEDFVEGGSVDAGKYVEPFQLEVDVVEDEAGEEAVFCVRDEGGDLAGRAGEDGGEARAQELHEFLTLTVKNSLSS